MEINVNNDSVTFYGACVVLERLNIDDDRQVDIELRKRLNSLYEALAAIKISHGKNNEVSRKLRKQADKIYDVYSSKRDESTARSQNLATELCSEALAHAENESAELARAYYSRSLILLDLRRYQDTINDIDRALPLSKCPFVMKHSLMEKRQQCVSTLQQMKTETDDGNIINNNNNTDNAENSTDHSGESVRFDLNFTFTPNSKLPCASEAIDFAYDEKLKTRYFLANRKIEPGELLIREKLYAVDLSDFQNYTHCSHCLKRTYTLIPCERCVYSMYCSEICKNEAYEKYHDIECSVRKYLKTEPQPEQRILPESFKSYWPKGLDLQTADLLALKLTILAIRESGSIDELKKMIEKIDNEDPLLKGFSSDGIFHSDKYRALYSVTTHGREKFHEKKAAFVESILITGLVARLTKFFKHLGEYMYFSDNEDVVFFAKLFSHNFLLVATHPLKVREQILDKTVTVGIIISPLLATIFHDRHANVTHYLLYESNKHHVLVFSKKIIAKGSMIMIDYGA